MKIYTLKSMAVIVLFAAMAAAFSSCSSSGTIKVSLNVNADTIRIINTDNEVEACVTGQKETTVESLSSGTYTLEIITAGYLKEKKEIKLEGNSVVNENIMLQPDAGASMSELERAESALLGSWKGESGGYSMTLVIDEVKPGSISGYDEVNGKKRIVSGTYRFEDNKYQITLNEPGNNRDEGQFLMSVDHSSQTASGNWESFDKKMKNTVSLDKEKGAVIVNKSGGEEPAAQQTNVQQQEPVLKILRATYGTAWNQYNVTSALNNRINNGNIWVEVSNATFGDPDPGKPKTLTVSYKYRGAVYNKILREKMIFRVP